MPYLSKFVHSLSAGGFAIAALTPVAAAADPAAEIARLRQAGVVLQELVQAPDDAIPQHILDRAEAIVVIPTLVKGGFIIGAEHGKGVMSLRDRSTRAWSLPAFVALTGGSLGWQIGVQSIDLVLLVMNPDGVDDLLRSEFTLGANASIAAGPVGRSAQAATDASMSAKILAYSRARGLFAGVSLQGASLRDDRDANGDVYGKPQDAADVFKTLAATPVPAAATSWRETLARLAPFSR